MPPVASSGTLAPFGTVSPDRKLTVDTTGRSAEQFHTVKNPLAAASVTVKFALIALAPSGTPPRPEIWMRFGSVPTRGVEPTLSRVSTIRDGLRICNVLPEASGD